MLNIYEAKGCIDEGDLTLDNDIRLCIKKMKQSNKDFIRGLMLGYEIAYKYPEFFRRSYKINEEIKKLLDEKI